MIVSPLRYEKNVPRKPPLSREAYTLRNLERAFPSGEWVEGPPVNEVEQEEMPDPNEVLE